MLDRERTESIVRDCYPLKVPSDIADPLPAIPDVRLADEACADPASEGRSESENSCHRGGREQSAYSLSPVDSPPSGELGAFLREDCRRRRFFFSPAAAPESESTSELLGESVSGCSSGGWGGGVFRVVW